MPLVLLLLFAPSPILTAAGRGSTGRHCSLAARARVGLTLCFLVTALGHVLRTQEMAAMVLPARPYRVALIYPTGGLEGLGAVGVWIPRVRSVAGQCPLVRVIGLRPANRSAAMHRVPFGGHGVGPAS
jgi:uncharacterized membrane protein